MQNDSRIQARLMLIPAFLSTVMLSAVLLIHWWKGVPVDELTKDPIIFGEGMAVYTGFLSQTGIFFWSGAASVCLFCGSILPREMLESGFARFLTVSGAFTLFLGLDDAFLLHETLLPRFGIPQNLVLIVYLVFTLSYLFVFRQLILSTRYRLLAVALGAFAISLALDVTEPFDYLLTFFEDGAKFVGLTTWATYFVATAREAVN